MFSELDESGKFVCDTYSIEGLSNWTKLRPHQPCVSPFVIGTRDSETGEWTGEWGDIEQVG